MKENTRKIIQIAIGILLIMTFTKLLTLAGIILLLLTVYKKKKEVIDEEELQVIDAQEHDQIRCTAQIVQDKLDLKKEIMQKTDVRQFQGRNDVTIDEVVNYMIDFSQYIGIEKRQYQMERISQVCNLTMDDMKEVSHQIWGKTKIFEDIEGQKIANYQKEKIKESLNKKSIWREIKEDELRRCITDKQRNDLEKRLSDEEIKRLENEDFKKMEEVQRRCNYDEWLKWKGYTT